MRKKIDILVLLFVLIGGTAALMNAVAIGDWWHAQRYDPPSDIEKIAEDAGMSELGIKYFYRFSPELVGQSVLDTYCDVEKLGCVEGTSLYILDFETEAEYRRSIVTASHEMLHVAWSRLSEEEISELETLLEEELALPHGAKINDQLEEYPESERINEAHSFIGSQLENIDAELETHYEQYFSDRSKSTQAYAFSKK